MLSTVIRHPIERLVIGLATQSHRAARLVRRVVTGAAVLALALGAIGFVQLDAGDDSISLSPMAVLYGTLALFVFAGTPVEAIPPALEVARLLAPLATTGALLAVTVAVSRARLNHAAARFSRCHEILIGPDARVARHHGGSSRGTVVHVSASDGPGVPGVISLTSTFDAQDLWHVVNGAEARRVTIATGSDSTNLGLLASAAALGDDGSTLEIVVEVDDRTTALAMAVAIAVDDADRHIDVVCPDALTAAVTAERVLTEISEERAAVAVGDGPVVTVLGMQLADVMARHHQIASQRRPRLGIVVPDRDRRDAVARELADLASLDLWIVGSLTELDEWQTGPVVGLVDYNDRERALHDATELSCTRPGSRLYVQSAHPMLPGGLVAVDLTHVLRSTDLHGVWAQVARLLERRDLSADAGTPTDETTIVAVRRAVAALVRSGRWAVVPASIGGRGEEHIPDAERRTLALPDEMRELPHVLQRVGLSLLRVGVDGEIVRRPRTPRQPWPACVTDEAIELMAKAAHDNYLERLPKTDEDHPANVPWAELPEDLKAQNRQQSRESIVRLMAMGRVIVPGNGVDECQIDELPEAVIEQSGRDEHDRWSRQKRVQGYRWGAVRHDGPGPLTHPDLIAWEDLTEAMKDRDRDPVREVTVTLAAAGLTIAPDPSGHR